MRKLFSLFAAVVLSMTCVFAQDGWTWTKFNIYPDPSTPFSEVLNGNHIYFNDVNLVLMDIPTNIAEIIIRNGSDVRTVKVPFFIRSDKRYYSDSPIYPADGYEYEYADVILSPLDASTDLIDDATYTLHIPAGKLKNKRNQLNGEIFFTYRQYTPSQKKMNYRLANDWVNEETLMQGVFDFDVEAEAYTQQDDASYHLSKPVSLLEVSLDDPTISHVEYVYSDKDFKHPHVGVLEKDGDKFVAHIKPALRFDAVTQEDYTSYGISNVYQLTINVWTGTYVPGSAPTYRNVLYPNAEDQINTPYIHVPAELEGWRGRQLPGFISTDVIDYHGEDSAYVYDAIQTYIEYYSNKMHFDELDPVAALEGSPLLDCSNAVVVENGLLNMDLNYGRVYWHLAGQGRGFACPFVFFDTETFEDGTHWHAYAPKHPKYGMDFELSEADFVACGVIGHGVKEQNHDGMHSHIHEGSHANPQEPTDYYTTFYDGLHTTIITSANTTAYAAKIGQDAEGTFVTLNAIEGNIIPQGVAVLLKGEGNEVVVEHYFDEVPAVTVPDNDLQGVDFTTAVSALSAGTKYTLAAEDNIMAFYHYTGENMNANKAYLQLPAGAPAPRRICFGTNTATGMENTAATIKAEKILRDGQLLIRKNGNLYNVQGALVK